jgi:hypothetical protein
VSDDILLRIDAVMEANRVRFDPLAGDQYGSRDSTDGMRWRPEGSGPPPARPHPASPYLTREDITGRRDRINDALRAEVRRQGLDEETIRIEAIRPVRLADPPVPWLPLPDEGPWRSFEQQAPASAPEAPFDPPPAPWIVQRLGTAEWIARLHDVPWDLAAAPPRRHACTPQTQGCLDGKLVERCACGGIRYSGGQWFERNQRTARPRWWQWRPW